MTTAADTNRTRGSGDDAIGDAAARLRHATTRLFRNLRKQSHVGLTLSQLSTLSSVKRRGPLPIGALADEEQISAPTATRVVDKLERAGHVERSAHPTDRRVTVISITSQGEELLADMRTRRNAWLAERLAELPQEDLDRVLAAIDILDRLPSPPDTPPPPSRDP